MARVSALLLCLFMLPLVSCWRTNFGSKHSFRINDRVRTRGRTWNGQPCPVQDGCIQLPRTSDVLPRAVFESQTLGINWNVMYQIDSIPLANLNRCETLYTQEGEQIILELRTRIDNKTDCTTISSFPFGNYTSSTRAILFNPASEYFPPVGTVSPTYYYMSDCPSEYMLMFVCIFTNTITNGFCNGDWYVDIGFVNNPADSPPFWKIENELYRKLGLRMSDRFTKFRYIGERCPPPP